jgi:hypothetical protein
MNFVAVTRQTVVVTRQTVVITRQTGVVTRQTVVVTRQAATVTRQTVVVTLSEKHGRVKPPTLAPLARSAEIKRSSEKGSEKS